MWYFRTVGEDNAVFMGIVVATVVKELCHVVHVGVAAFEFMATADIVYADEEALLALVGHSKDIAQCNTTVAEEVEGIIVVAEG